MHTWPRVFTCVLCVSGARGLAGSRGSSGRPSVAPRWPPAHAAHARATLTVHAEKTGAEGDGRDGRTTGGRPEHSVSSMPVCPTARIRVGYGSGWSDGCRRPTVNDGPENRATSCGRLQLQGRVAAERLQELCAWRSARACLTTAPLPSLVVACAARSSNL